MTLNSTTAPIAPVERTVNMEKAKRREAAIDSGYLVLSLLLVLGAASAYSEEEHGAPLAEHMHSSIKLVLEHISPMASEMLSVLELSEMLGEVTA